MAADFASTKENNAEEASSEFPTLCQRKTYYQEVKPSKPPLTLPGRQGKTFLSQDRLGVRLRARQVLCSKCSSVCNEKGENVKENARKEKEGRGGEKEEERKLKSNRPSSVSSSTSDNRRSCKAPASPTKGKVVLQKSSRVKRDSG